MKELITAGVDEVGRGCLAGPVVSAAVILKKDINLKLLKDSKKITFNKREEISKHIRNNSYYAIGIASVEEILNLNILQASLLSMKRAIERLSIRPDLILIDGNFAPKGLKNYKTIVNGDEKIKVISAASIIAKVYRDKFMIKLSKNTIMLSNFVKNVENHKYFCQLTLTEIYFLLLNKTSLRNYKELLRWIFPRNLARYSMTFEIRVTKSSRLKAKNNIKTTILKSLYCISV